MPAENTSAHEIEVTAEMKAARARVLSEIYPEESADWLAEDRTNRVYSAMADLSPKKSHLARPRPPLAE